MSVEARLEELGITLELGQPNTSKFIPVNQVGNLVFTSGQVCSKHGELVSTGKVGSEVSIEQAQEAAKQSIIRCLSVIKDHIGDLDRIKKVVKLLGFVQSADDFYDQPQVMNAASDLLKEIFGEKGEHARSAIGVNALLSNATVEIEMIVEIE